MNGRTLPASILKTAFFLISLALVSSVCALAAPAGTEKIPVQSDVINRFRVGSTETRFGSLEFVGGLELSSHSSKFGGMSAIRMLDDRNFLGVMDTGYWYFGTLERDQAGRPSAVTDFAVGKILGNGDDKYGSDAEGMVIDGNRVLVSFERDHRIGAFDLNLIPRSAGKNLPHPIPLHEFRSNAGMEAIAKAPSGGALDGSIVVLTEKSLDKKGDIFAAVLSGPQKGVFFVRRWGRYDITDADFLPDGALLVLERRFNLADGIGMRIRRIAAGDIRPGATVDGEVIMEANLANQIDNMEGLDVFETPDGGTHIMLVSDDNRSILQRTLMLEFRLVDEPKTMN
ncbi:esterase-like activity of phytase family protein [Hoeflea sp. CAU 1731]